MKLTPFVWLGSGRAARRGVIERGRLLDKAAKARLPVPEGGILLDELYFFAVDAGLVRLEGETVSIPDPDRLHQLIFGEVRFPRLKGSLQVWPVFMSPHALGLVTGGRQQESILWSDSLPLAAALERAWSMNNRQDPQCRHDVIVWQMVSGEAAGQAYSESDKGRDRIVMREAGAGNSGQSTLPWLRRFRRPPAGQRAYLQRLQKLMRGTRRTFGSEDLAVTWVDDGEICWLVDLELT